MGRADWLSDLETHLVEGGWRTGERRRGSVRGDGRAVAGRCRALRVCAARKPSVFCVEVCILGLRWAECRCRSWLGWPLRGGHLGGGGLAPRGLDPSSQGHHRLQAPAYTTWTQVHAVRNTATWYGAIRACHRPHSTTTRGPRLSHTVGLETSRRGSTRAQVLCTYSPVRAGTTYHTLGLQDPDRTRRCRPHTSTAHGHNHTKQDLPVTLCLLCRSPASARCCPSSRLSASASASASTNHALVGCSSIANRQSPRPSTCSLLVDLGPVMVFGLD